MASVTSVIKAGDERLGMAVAPFEAASRTMGREPSPPEVREDPLVAENTRLQARVAELDARIAALGKAVEEARKVGEAAGRAAMELEIEDSRAQALALLERGIATSREALDDFVDRAETLSVLLARTALEKLFGDDAQRQRTIGDLIHRQITQIDRHSLVAIEVSRLDFPDTAEIADLARGLCVDRVVVSASDDLPAGGCSMRLKVGMLDVGLDRQWSAVRDLLDSLADGSVQAE